MAADTGVVLRELLGIVPRLYAPSFVATLGDLFTSPVVALVAVQLSGRGPAAAGTAAAVSGLAGMTMQLPAASLYSWRGPRQTLGLGALISALGTLLAAASVNAHRFSAFLAATALMGSGRALMRMATTSYMRELAPLEIRGRATALSGGIHRAAAIVAPLIGGSAASRFGMAGPFILGGLAKALASVMFLLGPTPSKSA